ncbi:MULTISPECIES: type II toxin-antitoxin system RelE family toxin [unclassified Nostoc]|uniref:type II toxin-antitoxin system RelE family toxin n=1 Tax=unclassified Nostoc TaxID=2593658 RepID=UPI002AD52E3D|nr:type II toxin-antitoxin system RelE/ParE family toxin [Nostoc sp. ChiQUE02]MDZ8229459.1 type II toxin-antitoxin system RelE/ParE family toxin [Nostoc sp. ChiQUE02]
MNIEFRKSFEKDLNNIRDEALLKKIKAVIEEVENAENLANITNIKKLQADGNYYRIRIGDYRVGIAVSESVVIFVRVLHRKDVYRYFP